MKFYNCFNTKKMSEENGIRIVHNSPRDIMQVTLEMHQRLKGEWITTKEDIELQKHYNKIFDECNSHFSSTYTPSSIGAQFLKENLDLL